jgi:hypothetical protein
MTVKVELAELGERMQEYGFAYLVTVGDSGRAHVVAVTPLLGTGGVTVGGLGRHTLANVAANDVVTLVWPPRADGGYSLIVDGTADAAESAVTVTPSRAILHRPAPGEDGQRVGNDCVELPIDA